MPRSRETSIETLCASMQLANSGLHSDVFSRDWFLICAATIPVVFGMTLNADPLVVMPIVQLNPIVPSSCGVKLIMVGALGDRYFTTPSFGTLITCAHPSAWLPSMRHSTGIPCAP